MALKKSQLYSSLWSSCDELRGGMDASQYKDSLTLVRSWPDWLADDGAIAYWRPQTHLEALSSD